jgi:hypothetical protein
VNKKRELWLPFLWTYAKYLRRKVGIFLRKSFEKMPHLRRRDLCTTGKETKHPKNRLSGEGRNPILFRNIKRLEFVLSNEN